MKEVLCTSKLRNHFLFSSFKQNSAMEAVIAAGGALLSPVIDSLVQKLTSGDLLKYVWASNVLAEIKDLEFMLKKIYAVLDDAEEHLTEPLVGEWVNDLRNLAYDVEDVVDELATEAQKRKSETVSSQLKQNTESIGIERDSKMEN